jgi:hypothetical protein
MSRQSTNATNHKARQKYNNVREGQMKQLYIKQDQRFNIKE